nr:MAG TPA: HOLLIDAY JUNCTION RESOLVASE [Caudoviricetes sp.]
MNVKPRIILGIDISTKCMGISLVKYEEGKIELLKISHIKPKVSKKYNSNETLFLKAKQFKEEFIDEYKNYGITDVIIEEPLPNSQNNKTVITLLRFNGMLSQSIYETLGVVPVYISSYDARKYAFPDLMSVRLYNKKNEKCDFKKINNSLKNNKLVLFGEFPFDCNKKEILWNKINKLFKGIEWSYDKKGKLKTENFDASDSLVCTLGYINKENSTNEDFIITEKEVTKEKIIYSYKFKNSIFKHIINI